jgi:hypothetical protein
MYAGDRHLTTSEYPGLLAAAIRDIAARTASAPRPAPADDTTP